MPYSLDPPGPLTLAPDVRLLNIKVPYPPGPTKNPMPEQACKTPNIALFRPSSS